VSQPLTGDKPVTLINGFTVPLEESELFLDHWKDTARILADLHQPGFIRARLYRALMDDAELRFINVSEWDSGTALDAAGANPEWHGTLQRFLEHADLHFTARPAVYQVAVDVRPGAAIQ
jgi:heme-degrading monooxygenase HmoA